MVGDNVWAVAIVGEEMPWRRLFDRGFRTAYREIVLEFFLSKLQFTPAQTRGGACIREHIFVTFNLGGVQRELMLSMWAEVLSFYTAAETETPLFYDAHVEAPVDTYTYFMVADD
ncbi:hypothetical protein L1987_40452 [Smallanthus sonchifolius]|uniref:Uncharacterized protein n=1 Tax=Smallanthus sonchifolius TaxID=185202 RepID=A0ACB9GT01_9ASTR|nr:hypothetical protein L1987_40452 [Smallanthus sonchifolius]